jgi:flagellin
MDQLTAEVDRIGNSTEFNTKKLLNGGAGIQATQTVGTGLEVVAGTTDVKAGGDLVLTTVTAAQKSQVVIDGDAAMIIGSAGANLKINGVTVSLTAGTTGANIASAINNVTGQTGVTATYDSAAFKLTLESEGVGSANKIDLSGVALTALGNAADTFTDAVPSQVTMVDNDGATFLTANAIAAIGVSKSLGDDATVATAGTTGIAPVSYSARGNEVTFHGGDYDGLAVNVENASASSTLHIDANNSLALQIGANEGQEISISVQDMRVSALGIDAIDVTTQSSAKSAITTIDDAIKLVSGERSKLGAIQNRLEHTINNLGTTSENLTASESRIRDVDMAKEMMEFTKNNILTQAAQAMLAQANQAPQGVLQLLR